MYVKNMSPFHSLGNKTPYEMWNGLIPSMRHLKVFGSTLNHHIRRISSIKFKIRRI
jgi:hypothetical protein